MSLACSMEICSDLRIAAESTHWLEDNSRSLCFNGIKVCARLARGCARRAHALGEPQWLGPSGMKMTWMALLVPSWQRRGKHHEKMREKERERESCRSLIREQVEGEERDVGVFW